MYAGDEEAYGSEGACDKESRKLRPICIDGCERVLSKDMLQSVSQLVDKSLKWGSYTSKNLIFLLPIVFWKRTLLFDI